MEVFSSPPTTPKCNLNETIVVDYKLPSINTSFIVSSKAPETTFTMETAPESKETEFILPAKPTSTSNPFDLKGQSQFEVSDDEFQMPGLILNSNDFDFLLSRGSNSGPSPRDSILERFDPILGRKSIVPVPLINKPESKVISTVVEVNGFTESPAAPDSESFVSANTTVIETSVAVNGFSENEESTKSSETFVHSISADGDISNTSDATETHEPAVEANVTVNGIGENEESTKSSETFEHTIGADGDISNTSNAAETHESVVEAIAVVNNFGDNQEAAKLESSDKFEQSIGVDSDISNTSNATETYETVVEAITVVNNFGDNQEAAKLESSDKFEQSIGGVGDISQASSTTESYDTASICEPLNADVTMSVGLIHDLTMDNMKSLEQDKVEPNLKMNDEHKVKQEMVSDIERKLKEAEAREEALLRRITEKEKALNKMSAVVENYEKTMVEMISEREQLTQSHDKQLLQLKTERDDNFHHLTSLENTFSDLHVKYEKSKQMALEGKESEAKLVEKVEFCQQQMKLQEQRYDKLKNHALSQLEGANSKLEALNKTHTNEMKKLTAHLKKEELSRQSLMEQLAQKTKENAELVKICDELIKGADGS